MPLINVTLSAPWELVGVLGIIIIVALIRSLIP